MLAKRMPTILPPMGFVESLETTCIHSVPGLLPSETGLTSTRPFRLHKIQRYMSKISGPLMDRIDIQVDVPAVPYKDLAGGRSAEPSETIRYRMVAARNTQLRRFFDEHIYSNAHMGPRLIRKYCMLSAECEKIMENAITKLGLSARGYDA